MSPRKEPPTFPVFEVNTLPAAHVGKPNIMMEEANWLQNLEGDFDSNHLDWLHRPLKADSAKPKLGMRGFWNSDQRALASTLSPPNTVRITPPNARCRRVMNGTGSINLSFRFIQ